MGQPLVKETDLIKFVSVAPISLLLALYIGEHEMTDTTTVDKNKIFFITFFFLIYATQR